jgi:hypothetical protein
MMRTATTLSLALLIAASPAGASDPVFAGFVDPPAETRPQVFWQWINGNVTAEGVRLDLEWMQRAGIGGPILFDIGFGSPPIPQYVEKRIAYGTPEWRETVRFAASEARRLKLSFGMQAGGGWSETGGPWVKPEQGMKKLVWSEAVVSSPEPVVLPAPPSESGPFQDIPISARFAEPRLYRDVKVIAWRDTAPQAVAAAISSSGQVEPEKLADRRLGSAAMDAELPAGGWLELRPARSLKVHGVTVAFSGAVPRGVVEASDDGRAYRTLAVLPGEARQGLPARTFSFPPVTARTYRLRLDAASAPARLTEFALRTEPTLDRFEDKAGWGVLADNDTDPQALRARTDGGLRARAVLDLSDRLRRDGTLDWRPPPGRWRVLRFGWSLTGRRNTPASAESLGLEVDKLNAGHVRAHMQGLLEPLKAELGDLYGNAGLDHVITDSWEAGQANWTEDMAEAFAARRGYDLTPWLPVLTGRIVEDRERSERFLWDYRRTIADLLTERHFGEIARFLHAEGLIYAAEAPGVDVPTVADGLQAKGRSDMPMGEFWVYPAGAPAPRAHVADIREAASAAHVYGKPLVAAEALTTMGEDPWRTGPWRHKPMVDRYFAEGVNHIVLHTAAHQPFVNRKPGMTLRQYGQHLSRNETWAEDAKGWTDYLARSAWMLRQGRPGADIAYFYGEGAAASLPWLEGGRPALPQGYDFDYLDGETLIERLSVRDGRLILPSGTSYRALVIPPRVNRLTLAALRKLDALSAAGALIVAERPIGSPTLSGGAAADREWRRLARKLWNGRIRTGEVAVALEAAGATPAVSGLAAPLKWTRRVLDDGELYFIANTSDRPMEAEASFRVGGKAPELWNAETGARRHSGYALDGDRTRVPLRLAAGEAVFLVFRSPATAESRKAMQDVHITALELDRPWRVRFDPDWGPSAPVDLPRLTSWTEHPDPEVKYYSGAATYETTFEAPGAWFDSGARLRLDLGRVHEFATVTLNGRVAPGLWKPPFAVDVTDMLKPGTNRLKVRVVNFWANRMIGDVQPGARPRTFAPIQPFDANSPLSPSGLLGPVRIEQVSERPTGEP